LKAQTNDDSGNCTGKIEIKNYKWDELRFKLRILLFGGQNMLKKVCSKKKYVTDTKEIVTYGQHVRLEKIRI
jgi:hypothetical protein